MAVKKLRQKRKLEDKEHRRETMRRKEAARTRTNWYNGLQVLVNRWVLHARDKDAPCCTCGTTSKDVKYDAGHYRSRGSCKELRFELTNIHKQCSNYCNVHRSSARPEYDDFIKAKYGQEHYEWLKGPHKLLKEQFPHIDDIKAEIERYRRLLRAEGLPTNTTYK